MDEGRVPGSQTAAEVDGAAVLAARPEVIVVDVRETCEYATGSVAGARSLPAGQLRARLYELPRGSTLYLLCANGARSRELVPFLRAVGYDAYSVAGGAWALQEHLVIPDAGSGARS